MWSVYENRLEHSKVLLELGSDPTSVDLSGSSALSLCARLHLHEHLRLLLMHTLPALIEDWLYRLVVAAASGESRFSQIVRHGVQWQAAPQETLSLLQAWHGIFPKLPDWNDILLSALEAGLESTFGPSNLHIQKSFLDFAAIAPEKCTNLLAKSILTDNRELFDLLIAKGVPIADRFQDQKSLLHLCAQNPSSKTTVRYFGEELLKQKSLDVNVRDSSGRTPFMDALLARKWDLARLLLHSGADPLATTNSGYTILGLVIQTANLGAAKWIFKYSGAADMFRHKAFIVHPEKNISAIQEAACLKLPRAHSMKTEVSGLFLFILSKFMSRERIDFPSDGLLPNASGLDVAAANGNVHAVKALVKKGAHLASGTTAIASAKHKLETCEDSLEETNLERCIFIIERWEGDPQATEKKADSWTKLRTIDESNVRSSWEVVAWEWKVPDKSSGKEMDEREAQGLYVVGV